jgi:hypothetical protein
VAYEETRRTDSTQDDDKSSNNSDIIEDPFDTPDTMNQQTTSTLTTQGSITGAQPGAITQQQTQPYQKNCHVV